MDTLSDEEEYRRPIVHSAREAVETALGKEEHLEVPTGMGPVQPVSAIQVLQDFDRRVDAGDIESLRPIATGFDILDGRISGGIKADELILLAGAPGCGKTTMGLQMARNIAAGGQAAALYVCYEHDEEFLMDRLLSMESIEAGRGAIHQGMTVKQIRTTILSSIEEAGFGIASAFSHHPGVSAGLQRINSYGHRLFLLKASGAYTSMDTLRELVREYKRQAGGRLVLFVDYLQKVPVSPAAATEFERVTRVVVELKDLAMTEDIPVFAIAASDKGGIMAKRMRAYHLWGGSALAYEADIILMLADKYDTVAKLHLEFNIHKAQEYHNWVVCTLEKNRAGRALVEMEFQKMFAFCCFEPSGRLVEEALIDERIYKE